MIKHKNILLLTTFTLFCLAIISILFLFAQKGFSDIDFVKINTFRPKYSVNFKLDEINPNDLVLKKYLTDSQTEEFQFSDQEQAKIVISYEPDQDSSPLYSEPLVVIINRQVLLDDLPFDQIGELTNQLVIGDYTFEKLIFAKKYLSQVKKTFPNLNLDQAGLLSDNRQVIDFISSDQKAIGLIPLSQLDIQVHPVSLNGLSSFDQPALYPMQIYSFLSSSNQAIKDKIISATKPLFSSPQTNNLLVVGDIMMGRYVGVKISRSGDPSHSFEFVSDFLSKPDITIAQLEAPLSDRVGLTSEGMILVAQPETIAGLTKSGIDLVFNSSNHFGDALREGMEDNFQIMEKNNILYVGAGRTESEAFSPKYIEKNGLKLGFVSFVSIMPDSYGASEDIAGTAWINLDSESDLSRVQSIISQAKNNYDLLFVNFHWGTEYTPNPTSQQIMFAHAAIDSGADLIIGTHPHVVQADEIYQGKYIIYSLGNFIMDQMWSQETTEGVLLPIKIQNKKIISLDLIPTQIIDYSQVKIIGKDGGKNILQRIFQASHELPG